MAYEYGDRARKTAIMFAIASAVAIAIGLVFWWLTGSLMLLAITLLAGVGSSVSAWRASKGHTSFDAQGLTVYNGWSTRSYPWQQITDIRPARIGDGVEVDHGPGTQILLPEVDVADVPQLQELHAGAAGSRDRQQPGSG